MSSSNTNSSSASSTSTSNAASSTNNAIVPVASTNFAALMSSSSTSVLSASGTCSFNGVLISEILDENVLEFRPKHKGACSLICSYDSQGVLIKIPLGKWMKSNWIYVIILLILIWYLDSPTSSNTIKEYLLTSDTDCAQVGRQTFAVSFDNDNYILRFPSEQGNL